MSDDFVGEVLATVRSDMVDLDYGTGVSFEREAALAALLAADVLVLSDFWWRSDLPADLRGIPALSVVCNDVFESGADAETVRFRDLETLYRMWRRDPRLGPVAFAACVRGRLPRAHVLDALRAGGTWDLAAFGLGTGATGEEVRAAFADWTVRERERVGGGD